MKPKLISVFFLIVLLPLGLLIWLGVSLTRTDRAQVEAQFQKVYVAGLIDIDTQIQKFVKDIETQTIQATNIPYLTSTSSRNIVRKNSWIKQIFVLNNDGKIVLPDTESMLTTGEEEFLERAKHILEDSQSFFKPVSETDNGLRTSGWRSWFWDQGANFIFWRKIENERILGVELRSVVLLSDLIAKLPDSGGDNSKLTNSRITLLDAGRNIIYQWGRYSTNETESPKASLPLSNPFNMWTLEYYASNPALSKSFGSSLTFNIVTGLVTLGLALVGLSCYYYRENSRQLREASQRVSFVNQVSHELKTPLTNIRLYAELLEENIPDEEEKSRNYLNVIVTESQRLSRLIANVLTFAKKNKDDLKLRLVPGIIDEVIQKNLEKFEPALSSKDVSIEFKDNAKNEVLFDVDALEQILGNLLSNIEKYAFTGKYAGVSSRQEHQKTIIEISDKGPGIPLKFRNKAFVPFERLSSKLNEGVSGTGIGLAIAKELAQKHGGDLTLSSGDGGSVFLIELETPPKGE